MITRVEERARQSSGRVAIANSDAGGDAYAHLAIDQAHRAVRELVGENCRVGNGARTRPLPTLPR